MQTIKPSAEICQNYSHMSKKSCRVYKNRIYFAKRCKIHSKLLITVVNMLTNKPNAKIHQNHSHVSKQ